MLVYNRESKHIFLPCLYRTACKVHQLLAAQNNIHHVGNLCSIPFFQEWKRVVIVLSYAAIANVVPKFTTVAVSPLRLALTKGEHCKDQKCTASLQSLCQIKLSYLSPCEVDGKASVTTGLGQKSGAHFSEKLGRDMGQIVASSVP